MEAAHDSVKFKCNSPEDEYDIFKIECQATEHVGDAIGIKYDGDPVDYRYTHLRQEQPFPKLPVVTSENCSISHICTICNKKFGNTDTLRKHEEIHNTEKPSDCDVSMKSLHVEKDYLQHKVIHTSNKKFQCQYCEKLYVTKATLRIHERIHSGVRPYICDVCQKCFTHKNYLIGKFPYHSNSHINIRINLNFVICALYFVYFYQNFIGTCVLFLYMLYSLMCFSSQSSAQRREAIPM